MYLSLMVLMVFFVIQNVCNMPAAHASVFQLHKTGQTTSYGFGDDDGELQEGLTWPTPAL